MDLSPQGGVVYIHDPDTKLTLDLTVKLIGFLTWLCVRSTTFLSFDIVIPYLTHECITMGQYVTYIHDLCLTLRFGQYQNSILIMNLCLGEILFVLWHRHVKFSTWVYRQVMYIQDLYDLSLWLCGLLEVSLVSFTYSFYLVLSNLTFWFSDFVSKGSKLW